MGERWKPISELEGMYEVSDKGNVRSLFTNTPKILKPRLNKGYPAVRLVKNKRSCNRGVGKLVLLTFAGCPPPGSRTVKHIDGNPYNNNLENLKWNVRKSYCLPINQEARQLFYDKAEFYVRKYLKVNRLINACRSGFMDEDDICNEALLKIWLNIDSYDSNKASFQTFCFLYAKSQFSTMYSKELRKKQHITPLAIDGVDYIKEMSYEMKFYGDD